MDIKKWLEQTGMPVKEKRFLVPPRFPYLVYLDDVEVSGPDGANLVERHSMSVELYSDEINTQAEKRVSALLNAGGFAYSFERIWIDSERMFESVFDFESIEKRQEE